MPNSHLEGQHSLSIPFIGNSECVDYRFCGSERTILNSRGNRVSRPDLPTGFEHFSDVLGHNRADLILVEEHPGKTVRRSALCIGRFGLSQLLLASSMINSPNVGIGLRRISAVRKDRGRSGELLVS
jgi:hypothetical protein